MRKPFDNKFDYDAGRLRHKISFWQISQVDDGYGGTTPTETKILDTWAGKDKPSGYNQMTVDAGANLFDNDAYFVIRNRKNFYPTKDMRVRHNGNNYTIIGVVQMDDPCTFIQILCKYSK